MIDQANKLAPDEQSAKGTIVLPTVPLWRKVIRDLRWTFKDWRLVEWSAADNGEVFGEYYTAATGDKDRFDFLSLGINPLAKPIGFSFLDY